MLEERINTFDRPWHSIVSKWGELNGRCLDGIGDFPAWYVENSNSALFAAAAWQCGAYAICEVDGEKSRFTGRRGRPPRTLGRYDIELHVDNAFYAIEAKRRHFSLSAGSDYWLRHSFLAASVLGAVNDCRPNRHNAAEIGAKLAALVFFSGAVDEDADERLAGRNYRGQIADMLGAEIEAFQRNLGNVTLGRGVKILGCSLFVNPAADFDRRVWTGAPWPALCGLVGILVE